MVECVWFASATHIATLPLIGDYLSHRPFLLWARVVLMTLIYVTLIAALIPTGHSSWYMVFDIEDASVPAFCYFQWPQNTDNTSESDGLGSATPQLVFVWTVSLITLTYFRRIFGLFRYDLPILQFLRTSRYWHWQDAQLSFESATLRNALKYTFIFKVTGLIISSTFRSLLRLFESFLWNVSNRGPQSQHSFQ